MNIIQAERLSFFTFEHVLALLEYNTLTSMTTSCDL